MSVLALLNKVQPRDFFLLKFTVPIHLEIKFFFLDLLFWSQIVNTSEFHICCCSDFLKNVNK